MDLYDEDYFLRGVETGKSLYKDYRWLPDLTIPMAQSIALHVGLFQGETVADFGCARGYTVKALQLLGYDAWGFDTSVWAIENCHETVKHRCFGTWEMKVKEVAPHWIIAKDVLEHVELAADTITELMETASKGVFAVVPLSPEDGRPYTVPDYEKDMTHIHRFTLSTWMQMFMRPDWRVEGAYRVPGVKDNYAKWATGNGFITARRV